MIEAKNPNIAIAGNDHCVCIHHWLVETPNGTTSKGTCKKCGTAKDFFNTPEYMREGTEGLPFKNQWNRENKGHWADKLRREGLATRLAIADEKSG